MHRDNNDKLVVKKYKLKSNNKLQDVNLKKLLLMLLTYLYALIQTNVLKFWQFLRGSGIPWFKLSFIFIVAYVLFTRDMNFNFSLNAPMKAASNSELPDYKASQMSFKSETAVSTFKRDPKKEAYIKRFKSTAITEMEKFGIPASVQMAQALIESAAGESRLATQNKNHFGIKCFSKKCKKGHCANFSDDHHKDFFRKYKSAWESWRDHSHFIAEGRYKDLLPYKNDYKAWAKGLKAHGYATDPAYAEKLISIIENYGLDKLDKK